MREVGERSETDGSNPGNSTRVGFTGHQQDNDIGFTDMGGRVYDSLAGRFTTADPVMQAPFWSQGQNRYAYVFNDPINATDPSGFITTSEGIGIGVGAAGYGTVAYGFASGSGFSFASLLPSGGPLGSAAGSGAAIGAGVLHTLTLTPGGPPANTSYRVATPSAAPSSTLSKANGMGDTTTAGKVPGPARSPESYAAGAKNAIPCAKGKEAECRRRVLIFNLTGGGFIPDGLIGAAAVGEAVAALVTWIRGPAVAGGIDQFGVFRYFWAEGGKASFFLRGSRVVVDEIYRGTAARAGSAGAMLAKALQQAGVTKPAELFIPNVLQKTGESTAVLTNVLKNAAAELGGTVQSVSQGVDAGKTWVLVTIGY